MDSCAALFARPSLELEPPFKLVGSVLSEESSLEDPPSRVPTWSRLKSDAESLPWSPTGSAGEHSAASRRADVPEHPFDAPQQEILSQTQVMSKVLASLCDAQQYHMPRYKNWKNTKPERVRTALRQRPPWSGHRQRHGVPGSAREGILKVLRQLFGRHFQDEEVRVEVARPGVGLDGTLELPRLEAMIYGRAAPLSGCCGSSVLSFFDATCGVAVICVRRTCRCPALVLQPLSEPLRLSIWGPYLALTDGVLPKHRPPPAARATHAPEMTTHAGGLKEELQPLLLEPPKEPKSCEDHVTGSSRVPLEQPLEPERRVNDLEAEEAGWERGGRPAAAWDQFAPKTLRSPKAGSLPTAHVCARGGPVVDPTAFNRTIVLRTGAGGGAAGGGAAEANHMMKTWMILEFFLLEAEHLLLVLLANEPTFGSRIAPLTWAESFPLSAMDWIQCSNPSSSPEQLAAHPASEPFRTDMANPREAALFWVG
ncbi:unnamed protein product [Durusdinium trenchii]|uniref:Uncharacterized protein n=1 Tax=Durusdinium trenchii TaxID=1381693 RepID=A0ABP0RGX3_9DINO